jgi:hypothetical protein
VSDETTGIGMIAAIGAEDLAANFFSVFAAPAINTAVGNGKIAVASWSFAGTPDARLDERFWSIHAGVVANHCIDRGVGNRRITSAIDLTNGEIAAAMANQRDEEDENGFQWSDGICLPSRRIAAC